MSINYLKHIEINKSKWDDCILKSDNGFIYSTSVFLDNMATSWDALVMDDYEAVMPLPFRRKFGISYIYPPAFSQQIGITSKSKITPEICLSFLQNLPAKFLYFEMNFNALNVFPSPNERQRDNYILPLNHSFENLKENFSRSAFRNLKKATEAKITFKENIDFESIIKIHRERFEDNIGANANDYKNLTLLLLELKKRHSIFTIGAYNSVGVLIGGSIYFLFKNRITFIINGNNLESLKTGATHLLMYNTINHFSSQDYILDFEGSDFSAFVRFYKQYGAVKEIYKLIKINNLPWPVSLLKK